METKNIKQQNCIFNLSFEKLPQNYRPKIHLNNHQLIRTESILTYLGISLDRNFKHHLEIDKSKIIFRVALIKRLVGTNWGAVFLTLRASTLALAYSPAEYCAPVWTYKIDFPLKEIIRIISRCLRSTPINLPPCVSGSDSPNHR